MLSPNPQRVWELDILAGSAGTLCSVTQRESFIQHQKPPALAERGHSVPEKEWTKPLLLGEAQRKLIFTEVPPGFVEGTLQRKCLLLFWAETEETTEQHSLWESHVEEWDMKGAHSPSLRRGLLNKHWNEKSR